MKECLLSAEKQTDKNAFHFQVSIVRSDRKTLAIQLKNGTVIARAPKRMKEKDIYAFIESKKEWIAKHLSEQLARQKQAKALPPFTQEEINALVLQAKEVIPKKVAFYAEQIGVAYNRITIRCQRTRWGSCSSQGNLNFNCLLMLLPDEIIDSIVVHELCHRKQMNHSAKFYAEIERVFPDYPRCCQWLNQNGSIYLSRLP